LQRMLLGSHVAGAAIQNSMLGAAHALANGLSAVAGVVHGVAVGMMMPHVIRFNAAGGNGSNPYADLMPDPERLARRIEAMLDAGGIPRRLGDAGVDTSDAGVLPRMAQVAAKQWTATFNPRPVSEAELLALYRTAL
jgi:alcohol dehydrogenase